MQLLGREREKLMSQQEEEASVSSVCGLSQGPVEGDEGALSQQGRKKQRRFPKRGSSVCVEMEELWDRGRCAQEIPQVCEGIDMRAVDDMLYRKLLELQPDPGIQTRKRKLIEDIELSIQDDPKLYRLIGEEWNVEAFGSIQTGLNAGGGESSDLDVCLVCSLERVPGRVTNSGSNTMKNARELKVLRVVRSALEYATRQGYMRVGKFELAANARVPVLKFFDFVGGFEVDLCINNLNGVTNSELIRKMVAYDSRARSLIMLYKSLLKERNISGAREYYLSSYASTLLCLHFLQHVSPPIVPYPTNLWMPGPSENPSSLAELLIGFLTFMVTFDFSKSAISITRRGIIPRSQIEALVSRPKFKKSPVQLHDPLQDDFNPAFHLKPTTFQKILGELWGILQEFKVGDGRGIFLWSAEHRPAATLVSRSASCDGADGEKSVASSKKATKNGKKAGATSNGAHEKGRKKNRKAAKPEVQGRSPKAAKLKVQDRAPDLPGVTILGIPLSVELDELRSALAELEPIQSISFKGGPKATQRKALVCFPETHAASVKHARKLFFSRKLHKLVSLCGEKVKVLPLKPSGSSAAEKRSAAASSSTASHLFVSPSDGQEVGDTVEMPSARFLPPNTSLDVPSATFHSNSGRDVEVLRRVFADLDVHDLQYEESSYSGSGNKN